MLAHPSFDMQIPKTIVVALILISPSALNADLLPAISQPSDLAPLSTSLQTLVS